MYVSEDARLRTLVNQLVSQSGLVVFMSLSMVGLASCTFVVVGCSSGDTARLNGR